MIGHSNKILRIYLVVSFVPPNIRIGLLVLILFLQGLLADSTALIVTGEVSEWVFPTIEHGEALTVARGFVGVPEALLDGSASQPTPYLVLAVATQPEVAATLSGVAAPDVEAESVNVTRGGEVGAQFETLLAGVFPGLVLEDKEEALVADNMEGRGTGQFG